MFCTRRVLLCAVLAIACSLLISIEASPSTYLTADDKASLSRLLLTSQRSDGSWLGLKNTFFAVGTNNELKRLAKDLPNVPNKDKVCEFIKTALKTNAIEDIYYQVFASDALGCGITADDKIRGTITSALASSSTKSLLDIYYAVQTASILKEKIDSRAAAEKLLAHVDLDADALFKSNVDEEEGSVYLTGLALEALATLANSGADKSKLGPVFESATETLFSRFAEEDDETGSIHFTDPAQNPFKVTTQVVKGIFALATALNKKPAQLTADNVNGVAQYVTDNKQVGNVEEAYLLLGALSALSTNNVAVPIVVSVPVATISSAKGSDGYAKIRITDVVGNTPDIKGKVLLVKAYPGKKADKPIASNQEFFPINELYQFNLVGTGKTDLGYYTLQVKVTPDPASKYLPVASTERNIKIVGSASVSECQIAVTGDAKLGTDSKKYNCDVSKSVDISVQSSQQVQLTFSVKGETGKTVQVQQAFLRFTNKDNSIEKTLVVPFNGKQYSLKFSFNDLKDDFYGTNGTYTAELIVGDAFLSNPTDAKIAAISVFYPESARGHRVESPFAPKSPIIHKFREPEKRPPIVITTAFTAAVLAPGLILLIGLLRVGANISNFPFSGTAFINAVGFQATVGAILALFALYWLSLNMVQTLVYLGFLSLPFLYFANKNLSYLASKNVKTA